MVDIQTFLTKQLTPRNFVEGPKFEQIWIMYTTINKEYLPVYHKEIIYQRYDGSTIILRAGPGADGNIASSGYFFKANSPLFSKYLADVNAQGFEPLTSGADLESSMLRVIGAFAEIDYNNIPYVFDDTNSNWSVDWSLLRGGLDLPLRDDFSVIVPDFTIALPDDAPDFIKDFFSGPPKTDIGDMWAPGSIDEDKKNTRGKIDYRGGDPEYCFLAGTRIDMADGTQHAIEDIRIGDEVLAYDEREDRGRGALKPARVTRTYINSASAVLDFHGLHVTPGHVTLCGDGPYEGQHRQLFDIIRDDGAIVDRDGSLVRAATNCPVGSEGDRYVEVAYLPDGASRTLQRGRMRAGTLLLQSDGTTISVLECLEREGLQFLPDGFVAKAGEEAHPLYWYGALPKPEDYVLKVSGLTPEDLYSDPYAVEPLLQPSVVH